MIEIIEKFAKKLKKLAKYSILKQENECFIIGTKIIILEWVKQNPTGMNPFEKAINRELEVFFLISTEEGLKSNTALEFIKRNYPILVLGKAHFSYGNQALEDMLERFIFKNFKSYKT